jgi:hypothetical protein
MQWTFSLVTHSGHVVAFDPAAVVLGTEALPDLETLEAGVADGSILSAPALDDETMVRVLVDEPVAGSMTSATEPASEMVLRAPSGRLWVADPAYLHTQARPVAVPQTAGQRLDVVPGDYRASAHLLEPERNEVDARLRRAVGTLPLALRDVLGMGTFLLGALTVVGLPVYLVGRALEGGLVGAVDGLLLGLVVLAPLWLVVLVAWRLPIVRRVGRADEAIARRYPDMVITLKRDAPGEEPAARSTEGSGR